MKPNIETLPCFDQVAKVIGRERARLELWKVAHCHVIKKSKSMQGYFKSKKNIKNAIPMGTPQKLPFWFAIANGINPYTGEKV